MTKPLLSLQELSKSYYTQELSYSVLSNISLTINSGELIAIVGASGSGKSTLMNILGLLDSADTGTYLFNQEDVSRMQSKELAKLRNLYIGFVFQQFNLLPRYSVKDNIALPLRYRSMKQSAVDILVEKELALLNMQKFANHYPNQLSGGQQQRVALARALVGNPKLILADEPTGSLDSNTGKEIFSLFLDLQQQGKTIILVTHDKDLAKKCPRCLTLVDGRIIDESFR